MTGHERVGKLLDELNDTLALAATLVARDRGAFDDDLAIPLACEALSNRVGDLAKKLVASDPSRFNAVHWSQAARNRDVVVHHYARVTADRLWETVSVSFPQLADLVEAERAH